MTRLQIALFAVSLVLSSFSSHLSLGQDFQLPLLVEDADGRATELEIGTSSGASLGFDTGLDRYAPPAPPAGAFYAHLFADQEALLKDYRSTTVDSTEWTVRYGTSTAAYPVRVTWDPALLAMYGQVYALVENERIDMRAVASLTIDSPAGSAFSIVHTLGSDHVIALAEGWNLIGLPAAGTSTDAADLYPSGIAGTLFEFDGAYAAADELVPGVGYWLRSASTADALISGLLKTHQEWHLKEGWNLVSPISEAMPITSISDSEGILSESTVYGYASSYEEVSVLEPGRAYWLYAADDGVVSLIAPLPGEGSPAPKKATASAQDGLDGFGRIETRSGTANQTLYFGGTLPDGSSMLRYGLPPLPPSGAFDARLQGDAWLSVTDSVVVNLQARADEPVSVTINLPATRSANDFVLEERADDGTVVRHDVQDGSTIELSGAESYELSVYPQLSTSAATGPAALDFAIRAAYPNPFTSSATIKYTVPEPGRVVVTLADILGRTVATLQSEDVAAGENSVAVDAAALPSGVYIYHIDAAGRSLSGQLILVR